MTSDLPSLRESAPSGSVFVKAGSDASLARALRGLWQPAPSLEITIRAVHKTGRSRLASSSRSSPPNLQCRVGTDAHGSIFLSGNDGTGKTTQAHLLIVDLECVV